MAIGEKSTRRTPSFFHSLALLADLGSHRVRLLDAFCLRDLRSFTSLTKVHLL